MPRSPSLIPPEILARYEALVARHPDVERKGAAMPYTSRNGHMFSFLTAEGRLALRLPAPARADFVARFAPPPVIQHGAVMKEYVEIPDALLDDPAAMDAWFVQSWEHVGAMAPKPTTRKPRA